MSSPNDPLRAAKRRFLLTAGLVTAAWTMTVVWAMSERTVMRDVAPKPVPDENTSVEPASAEERVGLNAEAFVVELWNPPPPERDDTTASEAVDPTTRVQDVPINLELVAITDGEEPEAAVYDPREDTLYLVKAGDTLQRFRVQAITADSLRLHDGRRIRDLRMERADR